MITEELASQMAEAPDSEVLEFVQKELRKFAMSILRAQYAPHERRLLDVLGALELRYGVRQ